MDLAAILTVSLVGIGLLWLASWRLARPRCHRPRDLSHDRIAAIGDSYNPSNPFHSAGE